jgi:hypothetical protein
MIGDVVEDHLLGHRREPKQAGITPKAFEM